MLGVIAFLNNQHTQEKQYAHTILAPIQDTGSNKRWGIEMIWTVPKRSKPHSEFGRVGYLTCAVKQQKQKMQWCKTPQSKNGRLQTKIPDQDRKISNYKSEQYQGKLKRVWPKFGYIHNEEGRNEAIQNDYRYEHNQVYYDSYRRILRFSQSLNHKAQSPNMLA